MQLLCQTIINYMNIPLHFISIPPIPVVVTLGVTLPKGCEPCNMKCLIIRVLFLQLI